MRVILSGKAEKEFIHIPKPEQKKISRRLIALERNPLLGKKLTGELKSYYSLRAWPYRVLYEINHKEKRIEIHKIVHRQSAYK